MTTHLYENPVFLEARGPGRAPERPDRLKALNLALEHPNFADLERVEASKGDENLVLPRHTEEHLLRIKRDIPDEDINQLEADTYAGPQSPRGRVDRHRRCCGGCRRGFRGEADNAFVAAGPPATMPRRTGAMGFCFFNNVAIARATRRRRMVPNALPSSTGDVHHGNGTQDIFWTTRRCSSAPRIRYRSIRYRCQGRDGRQEQCRQCADFAQ